MPSRLPPSAVVVIPAYNAARTLDRTLASAVASADFRAAPGLLDIEIAVVDDRSTDETAAIVESFAARDRRIKLIRAPENGGPGAARNLGVAQTSGAFLFFLDADDVFYPNHIHACLDALLADDSIGYVFTRLHVDMPIHADWRDSLDESNPINFCVRRVWHDLIGGFADHPDFRVHRTEDTLYRMCLRRLVKHRKIEIETCEQFVSPGNALDRQRRKLTSSRADWDSARHDDGFVMTPAMENIALERLERVQKLRGG
jgi:glycosyltransferase involved in cell wall biosynthesis